MVRQGPKRRALWFCHSGLANTTPGFTPNAGRWHQSRRVEAVMALRGMGITRPDTTMIDGVSPVSSAAERMRRYRERRTRGLSCITVEPSTEALQPPTQPSASNGISEDRRGFVGYVDGRFVHYCQCGEWGAHGMASFCAAASLEFGTARSTNRRRKGTQMMNDRIELKATKLPEEISAIRCVVCATGFGTPAHGSNGRGRRGGYRHLPALSQQRVISTPSSNTSLPSRINGRGGFALW